MPAKKKTADVEAEDVEAEAEAVDEAEAPDDGLDEIAAKYNLPEDYVAAIRAGLQPYPPTFGEDHDGSTELHFEGGAWQITKAGMAPGETA